MTSPETFLIAAAEIEAGFRMPEAVECVEDAFRLYGEGKVQMPPVPPPIAEAVTSRPGRPRCDGIGADARGGPA